MAKADETLQRAVSGYAAVLAAAKEAADRVAQGPPSSAPEAPAGGQPTTEQRGA
jgi:hypothetical protein